VFISLGFQLCYGLAITNAEKAYILKSMVMRRRHFVVGFSSAAALEVEVAAFATVFI